jgi:hypothetical protein
MAKLPGAMGTNCINVKVLLMLPTFALLAPLMPMLVQSVMTSCETQPRQSENPSLPFPDLD